MDAESWIRSAGGALQILGVVTVAVTVNKVRKALGMDGVVAAAARRTKALVGVKHGRRGRARSKLQKGPSDRWPRVPRWLGWQRHRRLEDRVSFLERDVKDYHDFLRALLAELVRQRELDQRVPDELLRRVNDLDRHVVKVVGGGTKVEALGSWPSSSGSS